MRRTFLSSLAIAPALLLGALILPGIAAAAGPITTTACAPGLAPATTVCNLWAESGSLSLPGTSTTVWGYATSSGGSPSVPGPVLIVNQNDVVTVNLVNHLTVPTSIVFGGQAMPPDLTGAPADTGTRTYTFTAGTPGTYLYEAGLIPGTQYQVGMGMYGALIVRPTGWPTALPGRAYADPSTAFQDEALVILSEIDPDLNDSGDPSTVDLRDYAPKFFLVNGKAYTNTAPSVTTASGNTLLLRYLNAGIQAHSIGVLGLHQRVLAADGSQLTYPRTMVAETVAPGQSADVLISMPATTAASTKYALYDAALALNNDAASGMGGMLAFIDASGSAPGTDTVGPVTSAVALNTGTGALTASVSDAATGASSVSAAEYFIDTVGANGSGTAMSGTFPSDPAAVTASLGALSSGTHTIYVHGRDNAAIPNWGTFSSTTYSIDTTGPTTTGLTLTPNPSNGSVPVALSATGNDTLTGNSNITAAEYFLDVVGVPAGGTGTPMTVNTASPIASLSATIPAQGTSKVVSVRSKDAANNWGPFTTIALTVDGIGPDTTSITAKPSANNGSYGQSSGNPTVRITATFNDAASGGSKIAAGEGFIDTAGANGTGFVFVATDGVFDEVDEPAYADIPLSTVNLLSSDEHHIRVHGKDAAGNWGPIASLAYLIDRTVPTFTSISLAPNPTLGAAAIVLTVNGASDPLVAGLASGVAGGEYWIDGAVPAAGTGTPFAGLGASIPTASIATGTHTIGVRVRDAAGNWSSVTHSATVYVVPDSIFLNGFETGGQPWGWSGRSTSSTARLNVTTSTVLVGTRSLQALGNNTNYVQYDFGTTANPAWPTYDARFYFRPNANSSTGKDILAAASGSSNGSYGTSSLFHVRYRLSAGTPQVQIQVGNTANATWTTLLGGTSNNVIEVVWQAVGSGGPAAGTLTLTVNGTLAQTLTTASTASVASVRLGSVTSTGANTFMYFDAFASKRTTSPLFGP